MKQTFVGLRTIEAEAKTLHQHLLELDPEADLLEAEDGDGFTFVNDEGRPAWLPADIVADIFRASAPSVDLDAVWKAVREVVEPKEGEVPKPTGPRVTLEGILAKVKGEEFFRVGPTLTVCVLTLENGAHLVGESACVAVENFDEAKGRELARQDALAKAWPLEGYLLRERLYRDAGRNRSIARLCYEAYRAHALARAKAHSAKYDSSLDDAFEKAPGTVQEEFMAMVDTLRKDPEASNQLGDSLDFGHIFRAVVRSLG